MLSFSNFFRFKKRCPPQCFSSCGAVRKLTDGLLHRENTMPTRPYIHRVPNFLLKRKKEAYVPQMVSLGPLHHNTTGYSQMEKYKQCALQRMLSRLNGRRDFDYLIRQMMMLEKSIKSCYEEAIDYSGETLARMITIDACFILEIFRASAGHSIQHHSKNSEIFEPIFDQQRLGFLQGFVIFNDIVMLENQIPLCALKKLNEIEMGWGEESETKFFQMLSKVLVSKSNPFSSTSDCNQVPLNVIRGSVHLSLGPSSSSVEHGGIDFKRIKPGTNPDKITFVKKKCSATLFLPTINVTDCKEAVLRNLIAFEECQAFFDNRISRYMMLMDDLIDSAQDVALLRKDLIFDRRGMGSDKEVVAFINDLCRGITYNRIPGLDDVMKDVKSHYRSKLKVVMGEFVQEHCSKPWLIFGIVAAVVSLAMSAVQTYVSVMQFSSRQKEQQPTHSSMR
eukprot:Gb_20052 [translate_table: standard]